MCMHPRTQIERERERYILVQTSCTICQLCFFLIHNSLNKLGFMISSKKYISHGLHLFDGNDHLCAGIIRSDLYGDTTSRTPRASSLSLIAMTEIVLLRLEMNCIGCLMRYAYKIILHFIFNFIILCAMLNLGMATGSISTKFAPTCIQIYLKSCYPNLSQTWLLN